MSMFITLLLEAALVYILIVFLQKRFSDRHSSSLNKQNPSNVAENGGAIPGFKTWLLYLTDCPTLFKERYYSFSKLGKTCLLPGLGFRAEVILPVDSLSWIARQSNRVLSTLTALRDPDVAHYNNVHAEIITNPWHSSLIRTEINPHMDNFLADLNEEYHVAIEEQFGIDTESWTEIDLFNTMQRVVMQGTCRLLVGLPLCRDRSFIATMIAMTQCMFNNYILIYILPKLMRPIFGRLITLPNRYFEWRIRQTIKSAYVERVARLVHEDGEYLNGKPPDFLWLMIKYVSSQRQPNSPRLTLHDIAGRLAMVGLGSTHQISVTSTNMIFDMLGSDAQYNTYSIIQKETYGVLAEHNGDWTRAGAAKMIQTDSFMLESLRYNLLANRSMMRKVVAKDGVTTPDGYFIPYGSTLSVMSHPMRFDPDFYDNPDTFDPFRAARMRETTNATDETSSPLAEGSSSTAPSFVSTGPRNLTFGHGKNACIGRFLADVELKMMLAIITKNYDVELLPEHNGVRPANRWLAEANMPPRNGKVRVRRKKL